MENDSWVPDLVRILFFLKNHRVIRIESDDQGNTLREYAYLGSNRIAPFDYTIEQELTVNVSSSTSSNFEGVKVCSFNEKDTYTGLTQTSDEQGRTLFDRDSFGKDSYTF